MSKAFDPELGHDSGRIVVDKREIVILVDHSGSMGQDDLFKEVEAGLVLFLDKQRRGDADVTVTLAEFDDEFSVVYENVPLDEVPSYSLVPRGMTALYDAIGQLTGLVRARHKKMPRPERPQVDFVIATDGHENVSREWRRKAVKELLTKAQKRPDKGGWGWNITYLGANQDALLEGQKMGIPAHSSVTYDPTVGTQAAFAAAGDMTSMSAAGLRSFGYTEAERSAAMTGLESDDTGQ